MIGVDSCVEATQLQAMTALLDARREMADADWAWDMALVQLWTAQDRVGKLWDAV